ncbi:MAG: DNA double-strand break repair nuclease NurA [Dehalococcoidales bacterium]
MSLDLAEVVWQVGDMVTRLKSRRDERQKRLSEALSLLIEQDGRLEDIKAKVARSRTTWLVAGLLGGLSRHYPLPDLPDEFTVFATDGSQIEMDRHRTPHCFMVNIGTVSLRYGSSPGAVLASRPRLYYKEEDMVLTPPGMMGREQVIDGGLLGIKRGVEECRGLAELASGLPVGSTALALLDGTLILWGLEAYPDFVSHLLLEEGLLNAFDAMRRLEDGRRLALGSYISLPGSTEVVNVLRVALCPDEKPDCDHCPNCLNRACDAVAGLTDRELFTCLLGDGERSELFGSQSTVVGKYYGSHRIKFFYLGVGQEIARVEVPAWVADDGDLLGLAHTLVYDQCKRGHGYPVALSEAHEQAVVNAADRESFWRLVESQMVSEHLSDYRSAKSRRKKTRWL